MASVYFLFTLPCLAKSTKSVGRKPANFVPDDEVILVPKVIKKNFLDEFHEKHREELNSARKKLRFWLSQEQYAKDYGLENTGIVSLPTIEQKENFLYRNYLRFISKDFERSTNRGLQNTIQQWSTDDEIDTLKALELHDRVVVKARKSRGKKGIDTTKTVKVGKDDFKFGVQPRLEIGMIKFTVRSKYVRARAWIGVNGNQELMFQREFASIGGSAFVNYYIDQTRVLANFDKRLSASWVLRLTHDKDFEDFGHIQQSGSFENNIIQLRFNVRF